MIRWFCVTKSNKVYEVSSHPDQFPCLGKVWLECKLPEHELYLEYLYRPNIKIVIKYQSK